MRRWLIRIFGSIAVLLAVVAIAVQIILWTQLPKNVLIKQIERELGLRVSADRLRTGWLGRTTLTNVSLGLPLADTSFLNVQTLKVKHTTLFGLIFGRSVSVDSIELDQPRVRVVQDVSGQWNLQEVAELLARAGGGTTAAESTKQTGVPKLPTVTLVDGTIDVIDNQQHVANFAPLEVNGRAIGALLWQYDVKIGDALSLTGKLAPGGSWKHEVTLAAHNLDALLKGWQINTHGADIAGKWSGQVDNGKLSGVLVIDHAVTQEMPGAGGEVTASGSVNIEASGSLITLRPQKIVVKRGQAPVLRLAEGTIVSDDTGLHAKAIQVGALGGLAVLDASFDPKTMSADLQARWTGLSLPNNLSQSGTLSASLREPFEGHPSVKIDLVSQGSAAFGKWDTNLNLVGEGQSWKSMDWVLTAPKLSLSGKNPIQLKDLVGHVAQRWPDVQLTSLTIPERPRLSSRGAYNAETHKWYFWLESGGIQQIAGSSIPISLEINAWGDNKILTLDSLYLQVADAGVWAGGFYDTQRPNPTNIDVILTQAPALRAGSPIQGHFGGNFKLSGWFFKDPNRVVHPQLQIKGSLSSKELIVLGRVVGDTSVQFTGDVDNFDVKVETTEMSLFQGKWTFKAQTPTSDHATELKIAVHDLPMDELAKFAKISGVSGTIERAEWTLEIPALDLRRITMDSRYELRDLSGVPGLHVDRAEATSSLKDGVFSIAPLRTTNGQGTFQAELSYDLNNPRYLVTKLAMANWPVGTEGGAMLSVSSDGSFNVDLKQKGAIGSLKSTVDMMVGKNKLAHLDMGANLIGRTISLQKLSGNVLNGTFVGSADVDLDKPLQANGQIRWFNVDAGAFTNLAPALEGLSGIYSGTVTLEPARDPRPLAPVRIDVNVAADNAKYRSIQIGGTGLVAMHAVAYADTDRALLDHCTVDIAGGQMQIWARLGRGAISQQTIVDFSKLQLDQLAHVAPKLNQQALPGLLNGHIELVGSGANVNKLLGNARINLVDTDLGNFGPISKLYSIMHSGESSGPSGRGAVTLAFEQNTLTVSEFRYFNRGIDARGVATVGPINWNDVMSAPISGQVVGTARPLKNNRISVLASFDEVFGALQSSLTTIALGGTLANPTYPPVLVSDIGASLRELLVGEARGGSGE